MHFYWEIGLNKVHTYSKNSSTLCCDHNFPKENIHLLWFSPENFHSFNCEIEIEVKVLC